LTFTVLVADDDPSIRHLLCDVLEAEGYRVLAAPDGARALELAAQDPPDAIVTDLWMPAMDGVALVTALEQRMGRAIPALFMSAASRPPVVPPMDFLSKPFDLGECMEAVGRLLGLARCEADDSAAAGVAESGQPVMLVIEDDAATAVLVRDLLTQAGYAVEVAPTGAAGLARLDAGGVDLVLLDLILPDLDGLEICLHVRAHEHEVYLPIVILTAREEADQQRAGFAAGADDYVVKPFRNEDLLDRVHAWMRARQRLKEAHARLVREVERRAHDEAMLAMARTAGEHLRQPLAVLVGLLELWRAGRLAGTSVATLDDGVEAATTDLLERLETLEHVAHYEPKLLGSVVFVDLDRARPTMPPAAT
jgi:DNA-binding response OmpR family regulator